MGFVDADAHVDECEETWEYMDARDAHYKPILLQPPGWGYLPNDDRPHPLWLVGGNVRLKRYRDDEITGTTQPMREMVDVPARIRHMDELGIDVQVLYPTMFLHAVTTQPEVEWAVHSAYNRWLADKTEQSGGRLRWAYIPSVLNVEKTVADLKWAKDHGACAVAKKGVEYNRAASDPYFFPIYQEAERLDLSICFHQGSGTLYSNAGDGASMQRLSVVAAFTSLAEAKVDEKFPRLRFGFIEAGASWIPYAIKELGMRGKAGRAPYDFKSEFLEHHRFFVTADTEDDIPLLLDEYGGEDYLMIGTDYSHADASAELRAHQVIEQMGSEGAITTSAAGKIASDNARNLYGLPL